MEKYRRLKKKSGFTLVEMIVVLVILAILAAAVVPTYLGYIDKQKEKECAANRKALVAYLDEMQVMNPEATMEEVLAAHSDIKCPSGDAGYVTADGNVYGVKCEYHGAENFWIGRGGGDFSYNTDPDYNNTGNGGETGGGSGGETEGGSGGETGGGSGGETEGGSGGETGGGSGGETEGGSGGETGGGSGGETGGGETDGPETETENPSEGEDTNDGLIQSTGDGTISINGNPYKVGTWDALCRCIREGIGPYWNDDLKIFSINGEIYGINGNMQFSDGKLPDNFTIEDVLKAYPEGLLKVDTSKIYNPDNMTEGEKRQSAYGKIVVYNDQYTFIWKSGKSFNGLQWNSEGNYCFGSTGVPDAQKTTISAGTEQLHVKNADPDSMSSMKLQLKQGDVFAYNGAVYVYYRQYNPNPSYTLYGIDGMKEDNKAKIDEIVNDSTMVMKVDLTKTEKSICNRLFGKSMIYCFK